MYTKSTMMIPSYTVYLSEKNVIGFFNGRMEFGPRALGARSIIADPRDREMQSKLNLKIKYRESFRPFAPSVLSEKTSEYFDMDYESPYMLFVAEVKKEMWGGQFWTDGYYVSTVGKDEEVIKAYIKNQDAEDQKFDQLRLPL